jgi:DNA-binding CsgD family transcriptional regulator
MARRTWEQYEMYLLQRWPLTRREAQVAIECVKGKRNKTIALILGISAETVNKNLDRIYRVTGVNGRDQLAAELLVADIDNTPFQQSMMLAGQAGSLVAAGFADTIYSSRGERKRPRSAAADRLTRNGNSHKSAAVGVGGISRLMLTSDASTSIKHRESKLSCDLTDE